MVRREPLPLSKVTGKLLHVSFVDEQTALDELFIVLSKHVEAASVQMSLIVDREASPAASECIAVTAAVGAVANVSKSSGRVKALKL